MAKERRFLHEGAREALVDNVKRMPAELGDMLQKKFVQGAYEIGAALQAFPPGENVYRGDLGLLTAQTGPVEQGIHGEQGVVAENVIDFQEAKAALGTQTEIDKAVAGMGPDEQRIAASFREPPRQQSAARGAWRGQEQAKVREIGG